MMSDPFSWSIHLGRWAGAQVRLHFLLLLFATLTLLEALLSRELGLMPALALLGLLLLALVVHELAHRFAAYLRDAEPEDVNLWPLGNLVGPMPPSPFGTRPIDTALIALAGPLTSGLVALSMAITLSAAADAHMTFNPFGNAQRGGAPLLADGETYAAPMTLLWALGWFGWINWVLFLANLIPALPLDGGRVLRALTENPYGTGGRDSLVAPWTARVCALLLAIVGVILMLKGSFVGITVIALGILIYLMARLETRMYDEGGLMEEGIFGYDFSQGYTSLEAGPATVRPRREGVLKRWRRRRSELRRRKEEARQAAEEQRMDEILAKIHREGRSALTADENRFLVRVSARYKSRPARRAD
jgi:Zn-dependent protease